MSTHIEEAVDKREIYLMYQPIHELLSGKVVAVEALARWNSTKLGFVAPNIFVEIAEQTGIIVKLSEYLFELACLYAKYLFECNYRIRVSFNVSAIHIMRQDFVESLLSITSKVGVNPKYLHLEITETSIMDGIDEAIPKLERCKLEGFSISLDDFGTGYSSLNYLRKLPISTLKIDKSFTDDLRLSQTDQALFRSILRLGQDLNLNVVAEGVELPGQLELLKEMGCSHVQGYIFSKPLIKEEMSLYIKRINS
jgi:EAL domain-containing protein (putative c-di-GMP-specific phosphodiesterase class I)